MKKTDSITLWGMILVLLLAGNAFAQAPEGPIAPQPGVAIQRAPPGSTFKVQSVLVNTPVTVRDAKGEMVPNLGRRNSTSPTTAWSSKSRTLIWGAEPISVVVVVETSSRIEAILPQIRRTGTLLTQTVMGPSGEGAIIGFDDSIERTLQDFTTNNDAIENTMTRLKEGTSGLRLYDAMATGVEMLSARPLATPTVPGHRRVLLVIARSDDKASEAKLGEGTAKGPTGQRTIYSVGISSTRAALQKKPEPHGPQSATPEGTFGVPPPPARCNTHHSRSTDGGFRFAGAGDLGRDARQGSDNK